MKLCALTAGTRCPSSRFRIRQHLPALARAGIETTEHVPRVPAAMPLPGSVARLRRRYVLPFAAGWVAAHAVARIPAIHASRDADAVWLLRSFVPGLEGLVRLLKRPLVLDVDDAIWLEGLGGRWTPTLARRADAVIAGNDYLAEWFGRFCPSVFVVPTAVDCGRFGYRERPLDGRRFTVGWTGTSGNFVYLSLVEAALERVLREVPGSQLVVVADRPPRLPRLSGLPVRFVPWSPESEVEVLADMDVGLMPLADDAWTRGKCSFKMLQYMATGLPTVVSPVGMNRDVLALGESGFGASTEAEWIDALLALAGDADRRRRMGRIGREVVERHFDQPIVAAQLAAIFRRVVA